MKIRSLIVVIGAMLTAAGAANAQFGTFTIDWRANGQDNITVAPGTLVTVTGIASWAPAAYAFGGTSFRVNLVNADMSDVLNYAELPAGGGMGRTASLRLLPQVLVDAPGGGGRNITSMANGTIDPAQLPSPIMNTANPIQIFSFTFLAGNGGRTVDIGSGITNVNLYAAPNGLPTGPYTPAVDPAHITITPVPTPGSIALMSLGGVACIRRRRKN